MPSVRSSAITFAEYNPDKRELYITFKQGSTYTYYGVPPQVYEAFLSASSAGTYFNDYIKDKYAQ